MSASPPQLLAQAASGAALELLSPRGLLWLGLLVPLVILYILKVQRSRRRVASTWLYAAARRDLLARSPFRRLSPQIPLLLQALALLFCALALARPATRGRGLSGDHVAIIIDASASMSAAALDPSGEPTTRMELAKRAARDLVSALAPGSDALLLESAREARVLAPLDRDRVRLQAAIDRMSPHDVEGHVGAAIALAVDRLRTLGGSRRIVLLTDGALAQPDALQGVALPLEVITVGEPVDNAALVRVDVRSGRDPGAGEREQVQAFLLVANFGRAPRDLYVTMRQPHASDVLASRRVLVQPGERLPVVLTFHPSPGDYKKGLVFELAPHDAMQVDDLAYGRVPAGEKLPVFIASQGGSPWLERAFRADPKADVTSDSMTALRAQTALDADTFVVIDGACPPDPPGGDLLVVNPPPGRCFGASVGPLLDNPTITSWETADPRLRFLTLDGVQLGRARRLTAESATRELIRTEQGAVAADLSTESRSATLVGFDVGESDWPLKASFVLFTRNLLEQARAHRAHGITGPVRTGEPLRVAIPASARDLEGTGPTGERVEIARRGPLAILADTPRAGFYHLAWRGPQAGSTLVPANLASVAESDVAARPAGASPPEVKVSHAGREPDAHHEWSYLLALGALAFVALDVWYWTRRPRGHARLPSATPRPPARRPA